MLDFSNCQKPPDEKIKGYDDALEDASQAPLDSDLSVFGNKKSMICSHLTISTWNVCLNFRGNYLCNTRGTY